MTQELETNYTKIPNQLIDDTSISDKAKVTYIKMRRCAPSWTFSVRGLAKVLKKSIGTISGALKELEEKGNQNAVYMIVATSASLITLLAIGAIAGAKRDKTQSDER